MAKIAKTGDRKKVMDTTKSTDCPKCSKPTRIVSASRTASAASRRRLHLLLCLRFLRETLALVEGWRQQKSPAAAGLFCGLELRLQRLGHLLENGLGRLSRVRRLGDGPSTTR